MKNKIINNKKEFIDYLKESISGEYANYVKKMGVVLTLVSLFLTGSLLALIGLILSYSIGYIIGISLMIIVISLIILIILIIIEIYNKKGE